MYALCFCESWESCALLCDLGSYWLDSQQDLWLYSTLTSIDGIMSSNRGTKASFSGPGCASVKPVVWSLCHLSAGIYFDRANFHIVVFCLITSPFNIVWLEICNETFLSTKTLSSQELYLYLHTSVDKHI